jgi:hypothetical protein
MDDTQRVAAAPAAPAFPAPAPTWWKALLVCLLLYFGGILVRDALAQFTTIDWTTAGTGDASVDWGAARLFWSNISPYAPEGLKLVGVTAFGHPPTTAFWFLPLAALDHAELAQFLGILNLGLALALVAVSVFTLRLPAPYAVTAFVFGLVQSMPPALQHAHVIQISVWIAFAYVLAWRWLRLGHDIRAGSMLGLACTLKLFPGVLVLFLLFSGRLRAVAAAIVAYLVVAAVVTWRWGVASWFSFFAQQDAIARRWLLDVRNGSIHGVVRRAFGTPCSRPDFDDALAKALATGACLVLILGALWLVRRARTRQPARAAFDRGFALFSVLSVFVNPWIWEHYFYLLVLPALIGCHAILGECRKLCLRWRAGALGSGRLSVALMAGALGTTPIWIALAAFNQDYNSSNRAFEAYCRHAQAGQVGAWLLAEAQYLELMNWLPWPSFLLLFVLLLSYGSRRSGAPGSGSQGRAKDLNLLQHDARGAWGVDPQADVAAARPS